MRSDFSLNISCLLRPVPYPPPPSIKTPRDFQVSHQKGIQCRFGARGIIAESHFDHGKNFVLMLRGRKRYLLNPPEACPYLGIIKDRQHPSFRHSEVDWADESDWPEVKLSRHRRSRFVRWHRFSSSISFCSLASFLSVDIVLLVGIVSIRRYRLSLSYCFSSLISFCSSGSYYLCRYRFSSSVSFCSSSGSFLLVGIVSLRRYRFSSSISFCSLVYFLFVGIVSLW